MKGSLCSQLHW